MHLQLYTIQGPRLSPAINGTVPADWTVDGLLDGHARGNGAPMMWSDVQLESPLKGHSPWDLASIMPGSACSCLVFTYDVADDGRALSGLYESNTLDPEPLEVGHKVCDELVGGQVGVQ